ncbi:MAG: sigma-70 family RNA polymerase sigma factor [Oscillospiraceae bacterium]|nr:sigma-70 family RNA polymerase sigma factor [Oscillospiraceae bacterium]
MEGGLESYLRFLQGEQSALKTVVKLYWDSMLLFTNSYVHNLSDAEDIAQEALIKLSIHRPRLTHENQLKAYLFKICRNLSVNYLRKQKRHTDMSQELTENVEDEMQEIEARMELKESAQTLHRAMQKLKLEYREILFLRYFEQLTIPECAKVMKCSERQATAVSYQARQALRKILEKEGYSIENI